MRQLGIPNTKHFINITKIDDARKLWSRLQGSKRTESFDDANEEEYEDSLGTSGWWWCEKRGTANW
jgi:splicing factor 3A subunit 3